MDERLEKALEHANYRASIEHQRKNYEIRYRAALLHSVDGGTFIVSMELINFVDVLRRDEHEDAILIDSKGKPIMVADLQKFLDDIKTIYFEASNQYYVDFEALRKARNVKTAVGL